MIDEKGKIFILSKVASEKNKIEAYLNGKPFFPTTIELDITQLCSRSCLGFLGPGFVRRHRAVIRLKREY